MTGGSFGATEWGGRSDGERPPRARRPGGRLLHALGSVAALALAVACGGEEARRPAVIEAHGLRVDASRLSEELYVFNFPDYLAPSLVEEFRETYGVRIVQDYFDTNEAMLAKLRAGGTGSYDVVVASDYAVGVLVAQELVEPLDTANIPNRTHLDPRFLGLPFDPENRYSFAYQWGTTGIGYRKDRVSRPPDSLRSWAVLFEEGMGAGPFTLLDDPRETIGAALTYLGHSVNSTDSSALAEAESLLLGARDRATAFMVATSARDLLSAGELALAHNHGGDVATAQAEDTAIGYFVPDEGGVIWADNVVVPRGARHKYTAEVFINFVLDPENGAALTNETRYASPNADALPMIDEELRSNPTVYPDSAVLDRLEFIRDLGADRRLYDRIWTRLKAGGGR